MMTWQYTPRYESDVFYLESKWLSRRGWPFIVAPGTLPVEVRVIQLVWCKTVLSGVWLHRPSLHLGEPTSPSYIYKCQYTPILHLLVATSPYLHPWVVLHPSLHLRQFTFPSCLYKCQYTHSLHLLGATPPYLHPWVALHLSLHLFNLIIHLQVAIYHNLHLRVTTSPICTPLNGCTSQSTLLSTYT